MENVNQFPVYLKYPHLKTFFRVNSMTDFDQLDIIGTGYHLFHFEVKVYPDRLLIMDMLANENNHWLESNEEEWMFQLSYCAENLQEI